MVEALLAAGANPKATDRYGLTPVSLACSNANAVILKRLLDAGADPNSPDPQGTTALMIAARTEGGTEAVKLLLERGAAVNARDSVQSTALMWAVRANHPEAVDLLIHHDAEINARTRKGDPPARRGSGLGRRIARARHRARRLAGTRISGADARRDDRAALCRSRRPIEIARMLIAANAQVNQVEANGVSPLLMAIANDHIDVARLLLDHGADVNAADWWGRTPLWTAVDLRDLEVNKTDDNGVDRAGRIGTDPGAARSRRQRERANQGSASPAPLAHAASAIISWVDVHRPNAVPARGAVGRPHRHAPAVG